MCPVVSSDSLSSGLVIREPVGTGNGYWAGAPGAFFAADERAWYLTYRIRRPRGVAPDRGGEVRIARSTDLNHWQDVWSVTKDKFDSASIERCALRKGADGQWRYFVSYVDPADGRWCVSVIKAPAIENLDPAKAEPLFKARGTCPLVKLFPRGLEGVKDPWIFGQEAPFGLLLSVALPTASTSERSHSTLDIYNTGECASATGLAISGDLDSWEWQGVVFAPTGAWDGYCRRINSVVRHRGAFFAFYDGSASHAENYEEKTGLAVSFDLRAWQSLTPTAPLFTSPHASGSLRYLDAQLVDSTAFLFYEFARADGAHDLRLATCPLASLPFRESQIAHHPARSKHARDVS